MNESQIWNGFQNFQIRESSHFVHATGSNRVTVNVERPEPTVLCWRERTNQPHTSAGKSGTKPNMEWFSESRHFVHAIVLQ